MRTTETDILLASAARIATTASEQRVNYNFRGVHVIISVSAITDTPVLTPIIEGYDVASGAYYTLLTGSDITATGTTVLKIHPSISPIVNISARDGLPEKWRVRIVHDDTDSATYSVGANYIT